MNLKYVNIDMRRVILELLKVLPAMIIPVFIGIFLNIFDIVKPDYSSISIFAIGYTAIYALSVWFLAMKVEEKKIDF